MESLSVVFTADITEASVTALKNSVDASLATGQYGSVDFFISSVGGEVYYGLDVGNYIQELQVPTVTHNTSTVQSISTVMYSAGKTRYAYPESTFMFHPAIVEVADDNYTNYELLAMQQATRTIAKTISNNTGIPQKGITTLMTSGEQFLDAEEALKLGLIHEVRKVPIPDGDNVIRFEYNDFPTIRGSTAPT